jgi:uncharacterized protein YkwD
MRKLLLVTCAALFLVLAACTPEESNHLQAVNNYRTANGVPGLDWEEGAYAKAHAWSQKMADDGALSHSNLASGVPAGWHRLGENVAMAPTLDGALRALENSAPHRANLLNRGYSRIAIGVVQARGYFWVTEVFIG